MSEKKEKAHTMVYETQESLYEKALSKMNKDQLIVQYAYKVENYRKAAEMFREVGDYADAAELAMRCDELAQKAKEDEKQHRYDTAVYQKENAKSLKGYEKAAKLFEEIGDYKDSKNQADECGQRAEQIRKRKKVKKLGILSGALIVVVALIIFSRTDTFSYWFHKITGTKIQDPRVAAVATSNNEIVSLDEANAGDEVEFGAHVWYVLSKEDNILKLVMFQAEKFEEFRHTPFNETQENTDWEHCTLRKWLNSEFLEKDFSEEERNKILEVTVENDSNAVYGTTSGNQTKDKVYLLSTAEVEKYNDTLKHIRMNIWLRTSGNSSDTAAFMSSTNKVMYYGYPVTDTNFYTCPVINISLDD